jgi:hypothetical protein
VGGQGGNRVVDQGDRDFRPVQHRPQENCQDRRAEPRPTLGARRGSRMHSFQRSWGDLGRDRVQERATPDVLAALHEMSQL